jgi:cell division protein FtsB
MLEKITTKIKARLKTYSNIVFVIVSLLMLISLARNIVKVREAKERLKEKEEYIEKIRGENKELSQRVAMFKSEGYIEQQLRDKLGLAKEGETVVVLPDEETIRKFAPNDEKEEEILPDPNWKKWFKLFY